MSDLIALLRACKATPRDDAPRLILADWLDERGEETRARYIREQLQMPPMLPDEQPPECSWLGRWGEWAREANPDKGYGPREQVGFVRGLIHISSNGGIFYDLDQVLESGFDWSWVESLHCMCWSRHMDWTPLLSSRKIDEISSLAFGGDYGGPDLARQLAVSRPFPNLVELDLGIFALTDDDATTLSTCGRFPNLRSLSLDVNRITGAGARAIAEAGEWDGLWCLRLSSNPIGDEGARALATGRHRPELRRLDLLDCQVSDEGLMHLATSDRFPRLEVLFLSMNRVTDRGVGALLALPRPERLQVILSGNSGISPGWQEKLKAVFGERIRPGHGY